MAIHLELSPRREYLQVALSFLFLVLCVSEDIAFSERPRPEEGLSGLSCPLTGSDG